MKYFLKSLYKLGSLARRNYWTLRNRLVLSLIWKLGPGCIFDGRVHVYSLGGDVTIGSGVRFGPDVNMMAATGGSLVLGANCSVNQGTFVLCREEVIIGSNVLIGEFVSIRDHDHGWRDPARLIREQGFVSKPVRIGNDVWIGRGAVVLKGVQIGDGAVIAANAVVSKNVSAYTVVAGIPARALAPRQL